MWNRKRQSYIYGFSRPRLSTFFIRIVSSWCRTHKRWILLSGSTSVYITYLWIIPFNATGAMINYFPPLFIPLFTPTKVSTYAYADPSANTLLMGCFSSTPSGFLQATPPTCRPWMKLRNDRAGSSRFKTGLEPVRGSGSLRWTVRRDPTTIERDRSAYVPLRPLTAPERNLFASIVPAVVWLSDNAAVVIWVVIGFSKFAQLCRVFSEEIVVLIII